jgi:hypothetical protein
VTAEIEAAFSSRAGLSPDGDGLSVETLAGLAGSLRKIAEVVDRQWQIELRLYQAIFTRVIPPKTRAVSGGSVVITSTEHDLGPPDGFAWAFQRITAAGLASADVISLYRGVPSSGTVDASNFMNVLTGTAPSWHPGRTGLMLQPGESVVASGTGLTATQVTITGEVIQMEQWLLPHFLL